MTNISSNAPGLRIEHFCDYCASAGTRSKEIEQDKPAEDAMEVATFGGEQTLCRPGARCESLIVKPSGAIVENINIIYVVAAECLGLARGALENSGNVTH